MQICRPLASKENCRRRGESSAAVLLDQDGGVLSSMQERGTPDAPFPAYAGGGEACAPACLRREPGESFGTAGGFAGDGSQSTQGDLQQDGDEPPGQACRASMACLRPRDQRIPCAERLAPAIVARQVASSLRAPSSIVGPRSPDTPLRWGISRRIVESKAVDICSCAKLSS